MSLKWRSWLVILLAVLLLGLWMPQSAAVAQDPVVEYALGLIPSPEGDYPTLQVSLDATTLPKKVDLSAGLPPVGAQGRQASCVGWAVAYYYRSYQEGVENHRVPSNPDEILSPAFIYNQRPTTSCRQDTGMSLVRGLKIAVEQGVATLAQMPYDPNDACTQPSDQARQEALNYRAQTYLNLFNGKGKANLTLLKQRLASGDLFVLAIPVYSEFMRVTPTKPVVDVPAANSIYYGGHAVTVVGYDDTTQRFKFVNSWGTGWGEQGFGYLTYAFVQKYAWEGWVLVDKDTTPPDMPQQARELHGVQSNVPQGAINAPEFVWEPSRDPTATYQVYWGTDAAGTGTLQVKDPSFAPGPVQEAGVYYLRVRAVDAAGNSSPWHTLFIFHYRPNTNSGQSISQPLNLAISLPAPNSSVNKRSAPVAPFAQ
jgi:hypothetical protein